ncbi:hypothetical protein [Niabella terrae]
MFAIITGDIVNSRKETSIKWQSSLKGILNKYGRTPKDWELYRGDRFQLKVDPPLAFLTAIHIKTGIRQISGLDVRMAIGIGTIDTLSKKITESTGDAFTRSGESFDVIKKQMLLIATGNEALDETLNLMTSLALLTANNWSPTEALAILTSIENPEKTQSEIAAVLQKSQSSVSEALKRSGFDEISKLNEYYQKKIAAL